MYELYDVLIIGGGPAGMSAGVFAGRNLLETVILEKSILGGQPAVAERIENFPGFPELDGWDLTTRLEKHIKGLGVEVIEPEEVRGIEAHEKIRKVMGSRGAYSAKAVIVASGGQPRLLNVPGEKEFTRKGVHYCAHCAGFGYEGKRIAVVGGGESALLGALYLAGIGEKVFLIHRREPFRSEKILHERVLNTKEIEIIQDAVVEKIFGDGIVTGIQVRDQDAGVSSRMDMDAVFVYVGYMPNTSFVDVDKDDKGFIKVNLEFETSSPGIFACGNVVRENAQVISSMGEGALAALSASRYIMETAF
ncbi:MAG: FAD-dependent oxidoreductase [bacterium]